VQGAQTDAAAPLEPEVPVLPVEVDPEPELEVEVNRTVAPRLELDLPPLEHAAARPATPASERRTIRFIS
jgi:hypothetical protein